MNGGGAREAYTCLPSSFSSSTIDDFDMEEAVKYAVVKEHNNDENTDVDATIELTQWEEQLFQTLVNAAVAYETGSLVIHNGNGDGDGNNDGATTTTIDIPPPSSLSKPIEIRIAGGWVRDKIMKQESHDVDIALDSMSGHQFATIVQQYLIQQMDIDMNMNMKMDTDTNKNKNDIAADGEGKKQNKKTKKGGNKSKKPKIAVIAANPSQSKHLETATMRIHNVDCDFVHLRGGEVYTSESRIPTLKEHATPLDDALRRDFTVNSLFYNLRTKQIEDWTGRGVDDLCIRKVLVTPLDAKITFHDDPLRVLRAVRFAVRYDLTLSEEIVMAAKSPIVHESLHVKVSRERVGKELEGMLSGKNAKPCAALRLLTDLKLAGCVFEFPHLHDDDSSIVAVEGGLSLLSSSSLVSGSGSHIYSNERLTEEEQRKAREMTWLECAELIKYTTPLLRAVQQQMHHHANNATTMVDVDVNMDEHVLGPINHVNERIFYLSTFLYPLRKVNTIDAKGKIASLPSYIIRDSIKFKNKDVQAVTTLLESVDEIRGILNDLSSPSSSDCNEMEDTSSSSTTTSFCRLRVGLVLRNLKDLWISALLVAAIVETYSREKEKEGGGGGTQTANLNGRVEEIVPKIVHFLEMIQTHNLDGSWKVRPLMDGKDLSKSLDLPKGPLIGHYIQEQVKWMLLNPDGTRADCETHLRAVRKHELDAAVATDTASSESAKDNENDVSMNGTDTATCSSEEPSSKKPHIA